MDVIIKEEMMERRRVQCSRLAKYQPPGVYVHRLCIANNRATASMRVLNKWASMTFCS